MNLRIGSLFSGVGGLELGLERAGLGSVVWQCEREPYARRVLARHWPDVHCYDDVTTMGVHDDVPKVDIICGGFPCQDISLAGLGAGLAGAKSGLFFEALRIIRLVRPAYVVLENVAGLLARGLDVVVGALASLGYDCEWDCVPAVALGARHRRDRIFIIAVLSDTSCGGQGRLQHGRRGANGSNQAGPQDDGESQHVADTKVVRRHEGRLPERAQTSEPIPGHGRAMGDSDGQRQPQPQRCESVLRRRTGDSGRIFDTRLRHALARASIDGIWAGDPADVPDADGERGKEFNRAAKPAQASRAAAVLSCRRERQGSAESRVGRMADGLPSWVDRGRVTRTMPAVNDRTVRLKCLGNAVVPQVAQYVGECLRAAIERRG